MASVASIRHTVLRLIGLPSACWARPVTSARDCRRRGCVVAAPSAQAAALTSARSRGGKTGFPPPSRLSVQGEIPLGPSLPPMAARIRVQTHPSSCLPRGKEWWRVHQQDQAGSLAKLVLDRSPGNERCALGNKRGGEIGAICRERSRPAVHPFKKRLFVSIRCPHRFPQSRSQTTRELFLKRSTKAWIHARDAGLLTDSTTGLYDGAYTCR
jgi:hypothetical protein